jgi:hypothetical protein
MDVHRLVYPLDKRWQRSASARGTINNSICSVTAAIVVLGEGIGVGDGVV